MKTERLSAPMKLLTLVWENVASAAPHSWDKVNHSMRTALNLAIGSGMRFSKDDFKHIAERFRAGYWFSDDGGEQFYTLAVNVCNVSACQSFEAWKDRKPIIADEVGLESYGARDCLGYTHGSRDRRQQDRLSVDTSFFYAGLRPIVTSFSGDAVIACTYKPKTNDKSTSKVKRRFKITAADIQRDRAEQKQKEEIVAELETCEREAQRVFLEASGLKGKPRFEDLYRCPIGRVLRAAKKAGIV